MRKKSTLAGIWNVRDVTWDLDCLVQLERGTLACDARSLKDEVVALWTAKALPPSHWYPSLVYISFALDTYAGKDLYLPALNEADTAWFVSSGKGSMGVVSPNPRRP